MKIKEYGEISFDGHQLVVKGWRIENKGKSMDVKQVFLEICKQLQKNPNIEWSFILNDFGPGAS